MFIKSLNHFCVRSLSLICLSTALFTIPGACTSLHKEKPFDGKKCLDLIPKKVKGLKILEGPRTEKSIIRDMVTAICNGQMLFTSMQANDPALKSGNVVFRVMVEYTGEVKNVIIEETTIRSDLFLSRVLDMIENNDFVGWVRDDTDTVFLYPIYFGTP